MDRPDGRGWSEEPTARIIRVDETNAVVYHFSTPPAASPEKRCDAT